MRSWPACVAPPSAACRRCHPRGLPRGRLADNRNPPLPQLVTELWDLIVAYFKQETVVPLQQLGRWIAFGILGALLLGGAVVLLAMSGLRALQEETGSTFTGNLSWIPYMILFVALVAGGAITWKARGARRRRKASS